LGRKTGRRIGGTENQGIVRILSRGGRRRPGKTSSAREENNTKNAHGRVEKENHCGGKSSLLSAQKISYEKYAVERKEGVGKRT